MMTLPPSVHRGPWLLAAAALLTTGCETSTELPQLEALGAVSGVVWLDSNGNGELDGADALVEDASVALRRPAGGSDIAEATTGEEGEFTMEEVPVGDYVLVVDDATTGDTVQMATIGGEPVRVSAEEIAEVDIGLTYPALTTAGARAAPDGGRVFVEGLALNTWGTFGDSTVHVRDTTGALRVVRTTQSPVTPGDSVRIRGTIATRSGQPVLHAGVVFVLEEGLDSPPAIDVSTADAASAATGAMDAELVRIAEAVVQDTTTIDGELTLVVSDGSDPVRILLDANIDVQLPPEEEIMGATVEATGLLVPDGEGAWVLKPRGPADVSIEPEGAP